jgi:serine/threonine-protein kinase
MNTIARSLILTVLVVAVAAGCAPVATSTGGAPAEEGPSAGDTWTRPADGTVMVYVPAGEFEMGSEDGNDQEHPVHTVALDAFWIDQTEVTNDQFRSCVEEGVCDGFWTCPPFEDPDLGEHPVVCISWEQAGIYCEWVGGRLPTEAEWEYAARGPEGHTYPWGEDDPTCDLAQWVRCQGETVPVGSLPAGASWCGALDMAGNTMEWVSDWYDETYYASSPAENPQGPSSGQLRAIRGGSWWQAEPGDLRSAYRAGYTPTYVESVFGIRCAKDID